MEFDLNQFLLLIFRWHWFYWVFNKRHQEGKLFQRPRTPSSIDYFLTLPLYHLIVTLPFPLSFSVPLPRSSSSLWGSVLEDPWLVSLESSQGLDLSSPICSSHKRHFTLPFEEEIKSYLVLAAIPQMAGIFSNKYLPTILWFSYFQVQELLPHYFLLHVQRCHIMWLMVIFPHHFNFALSIILCFSLFYLFCQFSVWIWRD